MSRYWYGYVKSVKWWWWWWRKYTSLIEFNKTVFVLCCGKMRQSVLFFSFFFFVIFFLCSYTYVCVCTAGKNTVFLFVWWFRYSSTNFTSRWQGGALHGIRFVFICVFVVVYFGKTCDERLKVKKICEIKFFWNARRLHYFRILHFTIKTSEKHQNCEKKWIT